MFITFFTTLCREAVDFRFSPPVSERMSVRRSTTRSPRATVWVPVRSRSDIRVKILLKRKWAASNHFMRFNFTKKYISFPSPPRDRALVFRPAHPLHLFSQFPKRPTKMGRAEGGFRGNSARPPLGIRLSPFSDDFAFCEFAQFLLEVRTFS